MSVTNDFEARDAREDELPARVWEFAQWLRAYCDERHIGDHWTGAQYEEARAEAERRRITLYPDGVIDYERDA